MASELSLCPVSPHSEDAHPEPAENRTHPEDDHHGVYEPPLDHGEPGEQRDLGPWGLSLGRGLSPDSACRAFTWTPFLSPQQSTKVPQTPLHTSRVLKEDKERWEDVKVREPLAKRGLGRQLPEVPGGAGWGGRGSAFSHPRGFLLPRNSHFLTRLGQRSRVLV